MVKKLPENRVRSGATSEKGSRNDTDGTSKISFTGRAQGSSALQTCQHGGRKVFPSGVDENVTGETEDSARIYLEQQRMGRKGTAIVHGTGRMQTPRRNLVSPIEHEGGIWDCLSHKSAPGQT